MKKDINNFMPLMTNTNTDINIGIDVDGTLTREIVGKDILELGPSEAEKAMLNCSPKKGIDILFDDTLLGDNCHIYIITGRQESYRCVTAEWLNMYGIPYDKLIMFPDGFYTTNGYSILKYVNLKLDIHIKKDVRLALDDKEEVIKVFNDSGICACKVEDDFREAFERVLELKSRSNLR